MLASEKLVAFVSTTNADNARAFYRDKLGLRLVSEDNFALVFESNGAPLRVALAKEVKPAQGTVLGWDVKDLRATVLDLKKSGITCEIFGFFKQDDLGIWTAPNGDQVAWFKDPDGNILSVSHHVKDA
jgi:catechol 2,3-dioxygenase-like lactoylglutathione lyase family enzyme